MERTEKFKFVTEQTGFFLIAKINRKNFKKMHVTDKF